MQKLENGRKKISKVSTQQKKKKFGKVKKKREKKKKKELKKKVNLETRTVSCK